MPRGTARYRRRPISPGGAYVYVLNITGTVSVIATASGTVIARP
jgi:DNA-binding beta-propeller fold protein YncE